MARTGRAGTGGTDMTTTTTRTFEKQSDGAFYEVKDGMFVGRPFYPSTREELLFRRTRVGAENFIKRLGYTPGVATPDQSWTGQRHQRVVVLFTVEQRDGLFYVVQEVAR
jgi:hypothetical protein